MAILKSYLDESLLTQQEQAALRVCQHTTILAEGLIQLSKLKAGGSSSVATSNVAVPSKETLDSIAKLEQYLLRRIETVMTSYTAPSLPPLSNKETPNKP
jgi:hypothetical protein